MNDTFMKEKPVLPLILSMSLPMVLSMLVNSLYNIVDSFFVAQISEEAMTALSLVYPVQNFINAAGIGFGVGINAVIAFYLGAGDHEKTDQAATQGLVLAVIHGVVMTVCCIAIMPVFLRMFTSSEAVIELGVRYSIVAFAFTLIVTVSMAFEKLFQAVGNMKTTMISLMCGCITNIVLDPVLIFGYGPFPEMGIEGAALATGIGQALTLAIYLVVYLLRPIRVHIRRQYILPSKKMVIKLYSIGIPATLNLALPSLLISALNAILAAYSEVYILVLGIYYKLQTFIYLPANGIVQGMRPLIGYNYGAGEHKRVSQIYQIVLCMSGIIMVLGTAICLLIPGQLIGLFTHTEATIRAGETALRIIGAGFIVSAVSVTSSGALEGLGKGTPSLLISLCRYVVVIIPAAFLLSRFLGAVGVWNAFWITEVITAIISIYVYRKVIAKPAEPVNGQDERRIRAAVDSPARLCSQAIKGRQQGVLPPRTIIQRGGISMPDFEAYQEYIQRRHNAFCKAVIRYAARDKILQLRRKWERQVSLDYLIDEKFVQFAGPEPDEEYPFTVCGQTVLLCNAALAAALSAQPKQTQEVILRYYFLRQPQRVIGVQIGRSRSTARRHTSGVSHVGIYAGDNRIGQEGYSP